MIAPDQPQQNGHPNGNGATATADRPPRVRLPKPKVQKAHWAAWLIWLVPIGVAIGATAYFARLYNQLGPKITVVFDDATGIRVGETPVVVRGVRIGTVSAVNLSPDNVHADVVIQLQRGIAPIANTGTIFYMVRPDVSGGNLQGLSTLISGPYVTAIVGHGEPATTFPGRTGAPILRGAGMRVIVHAPAVDHLAPEAPVYYRGTQVGVVQDIRLADDAATVNVTCFIWMRYTPLLRTNSVFWPLSTAVVKGGLFEGIRVQLGTLRTMLGGGLAFATPPDDAGRLAQDGTRFDLAVDGPRPQWLTWHPRIPLGPDPLADVETGHGAQQTQGGLESAVRVR